MKKKQKYGTPVKKGIKRNFLEKMRGMGADSLEKEARVKRRQK